MLTFLQEDLSELAKQSRSQALGGPLVHQRPIKKRMLNIVESTTHVGLPNEEGQTPFVGLVKSEVEKLRKLHTLTPRDETIQIAVVVRDVSGQDIADTRKVPFLQSADQAQRAPQFGRVSGRDFGNAMHEDTLPGGDETGMAHKAVKPSFEGRPENIHRFKRQVVEHFINQGVRPSGTTGPHASARVQDSVQGEVNPHMGAALVLAGTLIF